MNLENLRQDIEVYLSTNFTAHPIRYENVPFTIPDNTPWVSCHIKRGGLTQEEFANTGYEVFGVLILQVFTPLNKGMNESNTISDSLATLFERVNVGTVWFSHPDINDVGPDNNWYQVNISIPFSRKT